MKNRNHVFLTSYAIAAMLILIGLNVYAYKLRKPLIPEDDTFLLRAVSHYRKYFTPPDVIPNRELEHAVQALEKYRRNYRDGNSGKMLFEVILSQKYLTLQQQQQTAAAQEIYHRMLEQVGEDKKPTLDVLIRTIDRFNQELDWKN